ncbi:hypothetical protein LTR66_010511 [Elasticomyces elasticus]|nr:hypothetical protein LTR66_010511 [Elasticomyces elasticus]
MTLALSGYSATFMRYSMAVTPKNYLLFACHIVNFSAQATQGYRYLSYWNFGGREKSLEARAKEGLDDVEGKSKETFAVAEGKVKEGVAIAESKAKEMANKVAGK